MPTVKNDYKTMNAELDEVLLKLQSEDVDIDEAIKLYERGMKLVKELEMYLKNAENKISKIRADFS